ncbi:hypothetical protein Q8F55_006034 [Vanrija albida]|uniref:Uncharacterized protein n=1 Tax=Vanrija albida TaxID=181172 RepID=A0ABR3Q4A4_9TREE
MLKYGTRLWEATYHVRKDFWVTLSATIRRPIYYQNVNAAIRIARSFMQHIRAELVDEATKKDIALALHWQTSTPSPTYLNYLVAERLEGRLDLARRRHQLRLIRTRETEWQDDLNRLWVIYGIPKTVNIAARWRDEKEVVAQIFLRMDRAHTRWINTQPLRKTLRRYDPLFQVIHWIELLVDTVAELDAEAGWINSAALFPHGNTLFLGKAEQHRAVKTEVTCFLRTQVAGWERGFDHLPPEHRESYRRETIADDVINVIDRGNLAAFRNHMAGRLDYCMVFSPRRSPIRTIPEDDLVEFDRYNSRTRKSNWSMSSSSEFSAKIGIGSPVTSSHARSVVL